MFCKKCGREIKDNAAFCPYCGTGVLREKTVKEFYTTSDLTTSFLTGKEQGKAQEKQGEATGKRNLAIAIGGAAILIFFVVLIVLLSKSPWEEYGEKDEEAEETEEYSVVGEWTCDDFSEVGTCLTNLVSEKEGYLAGEFVASLWDDTIEEVTFTVTESGKIAVGAYGVSVVVGDITYEILSSDRLMLAYTVDIPIVGNSITVAYNADYEVTAQEMTLDCFGAEITLDRVE